MKTATTILYLFFSILSLKAYCAHPYYRFISYLNSFESIVNKDIEITKEAVYSLSIIHSMPEGIEKTILESAYNSTFNSGVYYDSEEILESEIPSANYKNRLGRVFTNKEDVIIKFLTISLSGYDKNHSLEYIIKNSYHSVLIKWLAKKNEYQLLLILKNWLKKSLEKKYMSVVHSPYFYSSTNLEYDKDRFLKIFDEKADAILTWVKSNKTKMPDFWKYRVPEYFYSKKVGENKTVQLIIPEVCETGDQKTQMPVFGRTMKNGKVVPLIRRLSQWNYNVWDENENLTVKENGLYARESFDIDNALELTTVSLRPVTNGNYFFQVKCNNKEKLFKLKFKMTPPKDEIAINKKADSFNWKEMDKDCHRKGMVIIGHRIEPASILIKKYRDRGMECKTVKNNINLAQELYKELSDTSYDYLIRFVHANGYKQWSGPFEINKYGGIYKCSIKTDNNQCKNQSFTQEVTILGTIKNQRESNMKVTVNLDKYLNALEKNVTNKTQLPIINISCSSKNKSAYEYGKSSPNLRKKILPIFSTRKTRYSDTGEFNKEKYSIDSFLVSMSKNYEKESPPTFQEMRKESKVLDDGEFIFPDNPDYNKTLIQGISLMPNNSSVTIIQIKD